MRTLRGAMIFVQFIDKQALLTNELGTSGAVNYMRFINTGVPPSSCKVGGSLAEELPLLKAA